MQEHGSQELLYRAMEILAEEYDLEEDTFFLVVTKQGKDEDVTVGDQMIVGEFNLKSVTAFLVASIHQLCSSLKMNPFVFISRHITGYFLEQEKQAMGKLLALHASLMGVDRGVNPPEEKEEPVEEEEGHYIFNVNMMDMDN